MKKIKVLLIMFNLSIILLGCETESERTNDTTTVTTEDEQGPKMYRNPVYEPVMADPGIIRGDDQYFYAYGTEDYGEWGGEARVSYIPILRSLDLVEWEYVDDAFTKDTKPDWGKYNSGLWAPDIIKIGDTYNLYYSYSVWDDDNPGIGVATASHPAGPFEDQGMVLNTETTGVYNSIDQFVYVYEEKVYMMWGSFYGIYVTELTADGLRVKDNNSKELVGGFERSSAFEAPYIIEHNDFFYLFISLGHCCLALDSTYYVNVLRSESPLGPFIDSEGKQLLNQETLGELVVKSNAGIAGPGHNSVIKDDAGDFWMVYHGYNTDYILGSYGSSPRRSLIIDKLIWTEDGWPYIEGYGASYTEKEAPYINSN